jgi:hypothetical protein
MKFIRAVLMGALLWVLIFFEVCILMFGFKLQAPNMSYYVLHYFLVILLTLLVSFIYFRKAKAGVLEGLYVGVIFIIVGIVLDSIITIPLFMEMDYSFLISVEMLISWLIGLVVNVIVGGVKK